MMFAEPAPTETYDPKAKTAPLPLTWGQRVANLQDEDRMEKDKKKKYDKPKVTKVNLDAKCAVLGFCKINGSVGPSGFNCGFPFTPCSSAGS
jgi:hypothetical protein